MRKLALLIGLLLYGIPGPPSPPVAGCDGAGNCYVRAAATGAGTGADWTNAFTGFGTGAGQANPASLTRGVNYYVAGGNYNLTSVTTFSTAASGTTLITILAPTIASHGTATGWSNAFQAQAVWGPILVTSGYWTFNGVYHSTATGNPAVDWRTGYGFKILNSNGAGAPAVSGNTAAFHAGDTAPDEADHVTLEYFEVQGSGDTTCTYPDALGWNFAKSPVLMHNWIHDSGGSGFGMDATDADIVEYNWIQNTQSCQATNPGSGHSEGAAIRFMNNLTFAYNYMENIEGTGFIGTPCPGSACWGFAQDTWNFYGNVFFSNTSEWHGNCATGCTRTGAGNPNGPQDGLSNAIIQFFGSSGDQQIFTAWNWIGNTFYALGGDATSNGPSTCSMLNGNSSATEIKTLTFENNIGGNCLKLTMPNLGVAPVGTGTLVQDHNTYCNVPTITDTGAGLQTLATCSLFNSPATNDDFSLAFDTSAWTPLGSPFNVDILGNTRTSSRGAFQLVGSTVTLAPSAHTFAATTVGHSSSDSPVTFTLTNNSGVTITSVAISFTGANAGDFSKTTSCGTTLLSTASCQVFVTFTPTVLGSRTATLSVSDSDSSSPQTSSLSGTGTPAVINPSPANPVTFGVVVTDPSIPSTVKNEKHSDIRGPQSPAYGTPQSTPACRTGSAGRAWEISSAYNFDHVVLAGLLHQDRAGDTPGSFASQ